MALVIVEHRDGRSVADTAALAALTGRGASLTRQVSIRRHCPRQDDGLYDVVQCVEVIEATPDPVVLCGSRQAASAVGVAAERVRQWAARKRLRSYGHDASGRPLYVLADLLALREL